MNAFRSLRDMLLVSQDKIDGAAESLEEALRCLTDSDLGGVDDYIRDALRLLRQTPLVNTDL